MIVAWLAVVVAVIALVRVGRLAEELKRVRGEIRALRPEAAAAHLRATADQAEHAPSPAEEMAPEPAVVDAGGPDSTDDPVSADERRVLGQFMAARSRLAPEARARIARQLAARFEGRFEGVVDPEGGNDEAFLDTVHARLGAAAVPEDADVRADETSGPTEPQPPEGSRPARAVTGAASGASAEEEAASTPQGLDLEAWVGTTWALRLGLIAVAVAVALFARSVVPSLPPVAKVALAYSGSLGLFALGRVLESRLERFARPLMAGALAIAFFVSYAAHFVPAMRVIPLVVALVWMAAGVVAILVLAERWKSQPTAGLAIFLGHVAAFVAGGATDAYSLIAIVFLAAAAVVMLWRHEWLPLSLFTVVASYGSHLLWAVLDRGPTAPGFTLALNVAFLASYYAIFLGADLLWWRRSAAAERLNEEESGDTARTLGRALGPTNLALAVAVTTFLHLASSGPVTLLAWVFFVLAAIQGALTPLYRRLGNPDYRLYPALATVVATLGFAVALDGLSLNLVLALEAVALLVTAHMTRLRIFHLLAQAALAANFLHYWWVAGSTESGIPAYIGGLAIAAAYLIQALLEDVWYRGDGEWLAGPRPGGFQRRIAAVFDAVFARLAPALAYLHGAAAGILVAHQSTRFFGAAEALPVLAVGVAVITGSGIALRSLPVLLAATTLQGTIAALAPDVGAEPSVLLGVAAAGMLAPIAASLGTRRRGFRTTAQVVALGLGQVAVLLALVPALVMSAAPAPGLGGYGLWVGVLALGGVWIETARAALNGADAPLSQDVTTAAMAGAALTALMVAAGLLLATGRSIGPVAAGPVWTTGLAATLIAAAGWRRQPAFFLAGLAVLLAGDGYWLIGLQLWPRVLEATPMLVVIAGVPLAVGVVLDRIGSGRFVGPRSDLGSLAAYTVFLAGSAAFLAWCELRIPEAWSSVAFAGLPAILVLAGIGALHRRGERVAVALMVVALLDQLGYAVATTSGTFADLLAPGFLLAGGALGLERVMTWGDRPAANPAVGRGVALVLVLGSTLLALATTWASAWLGGPRTTVGWSIVGGGLMGLGFAVRSPDHRRVALAVLGITLVHVLAVDTQGLSDTAKTIAFLALGLSLIAVAWLYNRFRDKAP